MKLNDEDVKMIRALGQNGMYTHKDLGDIFGVTKSFIGNILKGRARRVKTAPLKLKPLRASTRGVCQSERSCVFPGLFENNCRLHHHDSTATYSVTRPQTGSSWLRTNVSHPHWTEKRMLKRRPSALGNSRRSNRQKLDEASVRKIKQLRAEGLSGGKIAKRFQVGQTCIYDILNGRKWADVI